MKTIQPIKGEPWLELLARCGGYYKCPRDTHGDRLGPLVGYAGKYDGEHQWVGDIYANFAKAERHSPVLRHIADQILFQLTRVAGDSLFSSAGFCGAPEGGKALAVKLADYCAEGKQYIFPEKRVKKAKTETSREVSELVFDRHEPYPGEQWWIVEDVCNNFSTTATLVSLIEQFGASVAGVVCFLNRSVDVDNEYVVRPGLVLPVLSLVRARIMEYRQDDPAVLEDIQNGNVVWKPKNEWPRLEEAMKERAT